MTRSLTHGAALGILILILLVITTAAAPASAQNLSQDLSQDDAPEIISRARGAERVVVATVTRVVPMAVQNEYGDQLIISRTTLVVEEVLQGSPAPTLTVDIEGGTLGDLTLEVSDMPSVRQGDRGVFFVSRAAGDAYVLHRRGEGMLRLRQNEVVDRPGLTLDSIRRQLATPARQTPQ